MRKKLLDGIGVINATPFTRDNKINEVEYRRHVRWMVEKGVRYITPAAGTGQGLQVSLEEHRQLLEWAIQEAKGKAYIMGYTGRSSTAETIELTRMAKEIGVDAVYIIQPFWSGTDKEGIYLHFKALAESVDIPIVMYNNPARAGIDFPLDIMERLVTEFENIIGLKQTVLNAFVDSIGLLGNRIQVIPKAEKELLMALALGASGVMTFLANIVPEQTVQMYNLFTQGKVNAARELYLKYLPLINALHFEPIPAALVYVLNRLGWDFGNPRLPIHPVFPENAKRIDAILKELELL